MEKRQRMPTRTERVSRGTASFLQRWAAASRWDWMDRWASVRAFAVCGGALFTLVGSLLIMPNPTFRVVLHLFWGHLPLLGACTLVPLQMVNLPARWLLLLPLAPALALLFERISPRTTGSLTRVLLPHEVEQLRRQRQEAATRARQEQAHPSRNDSARHLRRESRQSHQGDKPHR